MAVVLCFVSHGGRGRAGAQTWWLLARQVMRSGEAKPRFESFFRSHLILGLQTS